MRVLIAEDDMISRRLLQATVAKWGYEAVVACDGREALKVLRAEDAPKLAILDWMMPEVDGVEVCRQVRALPRAEPTYILLLTSKGSKQDIVAGLDSGADDYLTKPFDRDELRARLQVGRRMVQLQRTLADRVSQMEKALTRVKQLEGLLPICSYCKKVRDDRDYWHQVDSYISSHTAVRFSHGICPQCMETVVEPELERLRAAEANSAAFR
jgi:DNA-binding response OmpR family regulator